MNLIMLNILLWRACSGSWCALSRHDMICITYPTVISCHVASYPTVI